MVIFQQLVERDQRLHFLDMMLSKLVALGIFCTPLTSLLEWSHCLFVFVANFMTRLYMHSFIHIPTSEYILNLFLHASTIHFDRSWFSYLASRTLLLIIYSSLFWKSGMVVGKWFKCRCFGLFMRSSNLSSIIHTLSFSKWVSEVNASMWRDCAYF